MPGFVTWQCPVPIVLLERAYEKLREHQVLVGSFDFSQQSTYDAETYLLQQAAHRTEVFILIDRNLFSTAKDWASGRKLPAESGERLGALMLVAIAHGMAIEPKIALYEYADTHGTAAAVHDLQVFRHADNIAVTSYARLLEGELDLLPLSEQFAGHQDSTSEDVDFTTPLKTWRFNYPLALKIAQLERAQLRPHDRMRAYLEWMWSDYAFSAPATAFGVMFLSPGKCGHKKMIKNLHSKDPKARASGLRNACWDMCLLQEWLKLLPEQREHNRLWLLASADKALVHAARGLVTTQPMNEGQWDRARMQSFIEAWGGEHGACLYQHCERLWGMEDSPDRVANRTGLPAEYRDALIRKLESEVLA